MAVRADDQLARLRVAIATGRLPQDLGSWILEQLQPPAARRAHCVREIQRAAVATGKSRKGAAHELAEIVRRFERYPGLVAVAWYPEDSPERIVQMLMRVGRVPRTPRHLRRLIA
jgi:hypothetical protein